MRAISTLMLLSVLSIAVSKKALAQCQTPTTLPGVTYTFTGDSEGFIGGSFGFSNNQLVSPRADASTSGTVHTPNLVLPTSSNGTVTWRFDLAGNPTITGYTVEVRTSPDPSAPLTLLCSSPMGNYTGSTITGQATSTLLANGTVFQLIFTIRYNGNGGQRVSFDNFGTNAAGTNATLPVEYTGFDASKTNNGILLIWNVATEINVKSYEVERSTNGSSYTKIGTVGATNSNSYSFIDIQPTSGTVYYRIKNLDTDGKYKYSTVISYSNGKSQLQFKAFPSSTKGMVTFQHPEVRTKSIITINSLDGRTLRTITPIRGTISTPLDLTAYPTGTFLIRYQEEGILSETFKIFKQ